MGAEREIKGRQGNFPGCEWLWRSESLGCAQARVKIFPYGGGGAKVPQGQAQFLPPQDICTAIPSAWAQPPVCLHLLQTSALEAVTSLLGPRNPSFP